MSVHDRAGAMMRLLLLAVILVLGAPPAPAVQRSFPTWQGWTSPSVTTGIFDDWDFNQCTADYFYWGNPPLGRTHLGADSQGSGAWTNIRAMADGTIVRAETGWPGQSIGIVHYTSTGEAFMAVYGHLSGAPTSGTVAQGQVIGTTEDQAHHLHLGIRPLSASEAASYLASGAPDIRGQGDTSCPSSSYGYVDPIPWLSARAPGSSVVVDPDVSVSPSLGQTDPLTTFSFTASGFTPNGTIDQTFYNPDGSEYAGAYTRTRSADGSGGFSGSPIWYWEAGDPLGQYTGVFADRSSGQSASVTFTIAEEPSAPGTPGCSVDDAGNVTVSWGAAGANGTALTGYQVQYENTSGGGTSSWIGTGGSRTRVFDSLPLGAAHRFRARATNAVGTGAASGWSATCAPRTAPEPPANLTAAIVGASLSVTWSPAVDNGAPILEYDVVWEENGTATGSASTTSTSFGLTPPNPAAPYRFQVAARNAAGWSGYTPWTSALTVAPGPQVGAREASVLEGDSASVLLEFPVELTQRQRTVVSVDWETVGGRATPGVDFVSDADTLVFQPGETRKFVAIEVLADDVDEARESLELVLSNPVGATIAWWSKGAGTILDDDDPPTVIPGVGEAIEGNVGTTTLLVPLSLDRASERTAVVFYTLVGGTASVPGDLESATGWAVFPPGQTQTDVSLQVVGDLEVELDESAMLLLYGGVNVTIDPLDDTATATVLDDGDTGVTVPGAPTGVSAQSGLNGVVRVSWTPPADDGGAALDGYEVERDGAAVQSAAGSPHDWTGLSNGTSYAFRVRACNLAGCGAWSSSDSATPYTTPARPGTPSVSSRNNGLYVAWSAVSGNGSAVTRYDLQHGSTTINAGGNTNRTVSFGQDGTARSFRVRACNAAGCGSWSNWSASVRPKTIQMSRGAAAPFGYWYDTTVTGPPGTSMTLLCNDGVDLAFWSQAITIGSGGTYRDATLCYSGDLNPHWVNAGSLNSNSVNW